MGENYQKNTTTFAAAPVGAGIGTSGLVSTETKQYSDGLGRPYQTVNRKQSPAQMDVVNAVEYDKWGRVVKSYNPIEATTNTGNLLSPIPVGTPFTLSDYYMDPLSRIKSVTPPNWYATNYTYGANTTNEVLANHTVNSYFPANSLSKSTITDPDNKIAHIYSDKKGRTILAKNTDVANSGTTNSYYFYDDKDRTIKMMPPGSTFSSSTLNFDYTYDGADNLLSKKIPDAAIVNMKYNTRNQIALFQDGNLNAQSKWQCVQYDDFGRTIKSGLINNSSVPTSITPTLAPTDLYTEIQYGSTGIQTGKVTKSKERIFGTTDWLETNFTFDIYGRVVGSTGNNHLLVTDLNAETMTVNYDFANNVLSDTRVSKKTSVSSNIITQKHDYDHWGRNKLNTNKIGTAAEHTISQINYNWKNEVIEKNIGKSATATNYLQSLDYAYNNQGWLTTINAPTLGGTNTGFPACPTAQGVPNPGVASSTLDNNDLFHFELKYDVLQTGWTGSGPKNGNIGQVIWRVRGRERQMYTLSYDYLNRLTNASYNNLSDANSTNNVGAWNEAAVYDIRGNITSLTRSGKYKTSGAATCWTDGQIDNLAYTYSANTNRLSKIVDNAPAASKAQGWNNTTNAASTAQYTFDVNGNMINDPYKGVSIQYNFLNLPSKFTWTNVSTGAERVIDILYDGRGNKLRKTVTDAGVLQYRQDYVGGIEYRTTSTVTLSLESIYHAEGRVFNTTTGTTSEPNLRYEYAIRDHLGNTRLTFTDKNGDGKIDISISPTNPTNEVLQENHYYPFGMVMQGPWMDDVAARNMPYQYNGKELNEDFGLGLSDYGARWYDASLGRWWSVDPMAEAYAPISTYHYGMNNPIFFIDPDGMSSEVPPKNMPKEYRDREKLDIYKDEANPVRGLGQGTGPVYGGDNGASQQNCPTCPGIKKGDYIATTGEYASTDEVVVTGQHMAWRRSYMYSILGEVGGKKGSLDESQNPFIWSKKEITAVTDFEMQVAMAWATGPVAEWGIAGALARYRSLSLYASNTGGRVFWSGGKSAKMMAENYAKTWGMQTLEMTTGGRIMTKLDFILPKSISSPIWKQLSINFANGAKNVATVVHNPAGIPLNSVWRFTEYPILRSKNIEIIYPNLFK
jgi:RHS repeat-associated protein